MGRGAAWREQGANMRVRGFSGNELQRQGKYVYDKEFGWVTPTIESKVCVYGITDKNGTVKCAIEQAYNDGVIPWKKPISCHLYPIIAKKGKHGDYERVNYEPREQMCTNAHDPDRESLNLLEFSGRVLRS